MSEVISACDNICRDFSSWFPATISVLGDLGTFLVGIGAIAAFLQLSVWRSQTKAVARSEVAKNCLVAVYEADEALRIIRNPFDSIPADQAAEKGISYQRRYKRLVSRSEVFTKLRKAQIDQDIVLGDDDVSQAIGQLFKLRGEVASAIELLFEELEDETANDSTREEKVKWRKQMSGNYSSRDEFGQRQIATVEKIKSALSDIARLSK